MGMLQFFVLIILLAAAQCRNSETKNVAAENESLSETTNRIPESELFQKTGNGGLLLTRFKSLKELKSIVKFTYSESVPDSAQEIPGNSKVLLTYRSGGREVTSILRSGVNENDFLKARDGNLWDKLQMTFKSPYAVLNKRDLMSIESLGRKRPPLFGKGDVAFYDLAETMVYHISVDDLMFMSSEDLSEKGYLNTFNHITAQAFMTSIYSETLADFVGDVHERTRMPELITGKFTPDQLTDLEDGAIDNYIDMINNEWGQDLGKMLRRKYSINPRTYWTPELLTNYLNDIQSYYSWAFRIAFRPFRATDEIVKQFAHKINRVIDDVPRIRLHH
jgi:hypothetical protein